MRPAPVEETVVPPARRRRRPVWIAAALVVLLAAAYALHATRAAHQPGADTAAGRPPMPAVPVVAATARQGDLPIYLTGLGSVAAFNTVSVRSRVDGELIEVGFQEGQLVHEGDLLARVDPRPFEVQLTQAEGQMARDTAQLRDARLTLARFRELHAQKVISTQELDDQAAKAGQFEGAVRADQGLIDGARLQLTYCRITAPIGGRAGLRRVDVGNMVHANDQNGIVVITQLQPIAALFTIPEDDLPPVMKKLGVGEPLRVDAFDRAGQNQIATGSLLTADNQIDPSTGTTRLKAVFPNDDGALFPNQFVNVRLLLDTKKGTVIVPAAAVQRGPQGTFAYVVKADQTVDVRPITPGPATGTEASIESGLSAGDVVVVEGVEKLRAGSAVRVRAPEGQPPLHPAA
jgi:membrane fusion protein, multidrug efflux system